MIRLPYRLGRSHRRGFSLIEVLIAIVVLSVGMLALAALQGNLTRSTADARLRSQALNHAHRCIDNLRAQAQDFGTFYQTLATATSVSCNPASSVGETSASYTSAVTVQRYVSTSVATACTAIGQTAPCFVAKGNPATPPTAANPAYASGVPEYKQVTMTVGWTDAAGQTSSLALTDIFSPTKTRSSDELIEKPIAGSLVSGPKVRITKPSGVGVIPIAVGDGSQATAASNPRPRSFAVGRTDVTQFEVLQYKADGANAVLAQKIELASAGCSCKLTAPTTGTSTFFLQKREPVYWNGSQYVGAEIAPSTKTQGTLNTAISQDPDLCTVCCSNHHDYTGSPIKFDSTRPAVDYAEGDHKHYPFSNPYNASTAAVSSGGTYHEVCRLVRYEGFWQVATDARLAQMNLLETDLTESAAIDLGKPKATAVTRYQAFARDLLINKFLDGNTTTANPNTEDPLTATLQSSYVDILVQPSRLDFTQMSSTASPPKHYLHSRGLYIDHIEDDALAKIKKSLEQCTATTASGKLDCILLNLPIVTVNTKDVSKWASTNTLATPATTAKIAITNSGSPRNHGRVTRVANGQDGAQVKIGRSNSGLADVAETDPCDAATNNATFSCAAEKLADIQSFCVGSGGCTVEDDSSQFFLDTVGPDDGIFSFSDFGASWSMPSASGECASPNSGGRSVCLVPSTVTYPQTASLTLRGYNKAGTPVDVPNPCDATAPAVKANVCVNYDVGTVNYRGSDVPNIRVDGVLLAALDPAGTVSTGGTSKRKSETTVINILSASVNENSVISVTLITGDPASETLTPICDDAEGGLITYPLCD